MGRQPDRLVNYGVRESRKALGMDFRQKSNYDPTIHEKNEPVISQLHAKPVVEEAAPTVQEQGEKLRLTYPAIAEAPTFDFTSKEWGVDHDPRGVKAIGKSFYDEAVSAREAVYAFYAAHKGVQITQADQKEYQRLYRRAEKTLHRVQTIRNLVDLVQSDLSGEALRSRASGMRQSIATSLANFDVKETSAEVSNLIAQDIQSLGGVLKWLWDARKVDRRQFGAMARLGAVLLFGTVIPLSQAACQVTVEPGVPALVTEPTDEAPETSATEVTEEVEATDPALVEAPTDVPATPTAEAEPTAIPSNVSFAPEVTDTEQKNTYFIKFVEAGVLPVPAYLEGQVQVHPGTQPIVSEQSLLIVSDRVAFLTGDAANYEGTGYGPGDVVVLNPDYTFDRIYGHLVFDGVNAVDVLADPSYTFSISDGVPTWKSSDPSKDTYIWVEWYSDGEFITTEFMAQQVELMQQEEDLAEAQAFAQANGLSPIDHLVYNDETLGGQIVAYDAAGNPVLQKENETADWKETVPAKEWVFGPEEQVPSLLEGKGMPTQVIIYDVVRQSWEVVPFGSGRMNEMNPRGVRILSADEFYQQQRQYINGAVTTAFLPYDEKIGTNDIIGQVTAYILLDSFTHELVGKGITLYGVKAYTYVPDSEGNPVLAIIDITIQSDGISDAEFSHFASTPNSDLLRSRTIPWGSVDEFVDRNIVDPNNPNMVLVFGIHGGTYYSGEGQARKNFDTAAAGGGGLDLTQISDTNAYRGHSGPISFGGLMLTAPLGE